MSKRFEIERSMPANRGDFEAVGSLGEQLWRLSTSDDAFHSAEEMFCCILDHPKVWEATGSDDPLVQLRETVIEARAEFLKARGVAMARVKNPQAPLSVEDAAVCDRAWWAAINCQNACEELLSDPDIGIMAVRLQERLGDVMGPVNQVAEYSIRERPTKEREQQQEAETERKQNEPKLTLEGFEVAGYLAEMLSLLSATDYIFETVCQRCEQICDDHKVFNSKWTGSPLVKIRDAANNLFAETLKARSVGLSRQADPQAPLSIEDALICDRVSRTLQGCARALEKAAEGTEWSEVADGIGDEMEALWLPLDHTAEYSIRMNGAWQLDSRKLKQRCIAMRECKESAAEQATSPAETPATDQPADQSPEGPGVSDTPGQPADAASQPTEADAEAAKEAKRIRERRRAERRSSQKRIAAAWPDAYCKTLHLQTGLVRRQLAAGDTVGAMEQSAGILDAFVRALHTSRTGSITRHHPIDVCLSRLRDNDLITAEDLYRLMNAQRMISRARESDSGTVAEAAAGAALSAVELAVAGGGDPTKKGRTRMKRKIKRDTARAVAEFHADPGKAASVDAKQADPDEATAEEPPAAPDE